MELLGKSLGNRYELLEKIGSGGMAIVYKAKCRLLKRYVAVKVLKTEFNQDEEFLGRFEIEAQASASLSHPNIVSIHDVGYEKGMHYIVMEFIEGKTLKEYIRQEGKLPWRDSVNIALQISSALSSAHKNKIVHRDIKPQNIIINSEGVAKVTDFGIAKAVSSATITKTGNTIGSVHYISPEQAQGGYVDAKSDLYSLGVVMYEMVTGKMPFNGDNPVSIAMKHINETPENPYNLNNQIPESLSNLILRLLRKKPEERYESATELKNDLYKIYSNPDTNINRIKNIEDQPTIMLKAVDKTMDSPEVKKTTKVNVKREQGNMKRSNLKKKKSFFKRNQRKFILRVGVFIIIASLLSTGAIAGYGALRNIWNDLFGVEVVEYILEDFTNIEYDEAVARLKSKLENPIISKLEEYSDDVKAGIIIAQDIESGGSYKNILEIEFTVSKGPEFVEIPNLENVDYRTAEISLETLGIKFITNTEISEDIDENKIIRTEPGAGERLKPGSEIILVKSLGPEAKEVEIPDLTGMAEEEAIQKLVDLKLSLGEALPIERIEGALITDQYPLPGEIVEEGEVVDIYFYPVDEDEIIDEIIDESNNSTTTPQKGTRITVDDTFTTLSGDNYSNHRDEEKIKVYIEVTPSDTGLTIIVLNSIYNKDTLPRTIDFSYEVPENGSTTVTILVNNKFADSYVKTN